MQKIISALLCLMMFYVAPSFGQSSPVHLNAIAQRLNDSTAELKIHAVLDKGFELFSTKKTTAEDAFVSSIEMDSSIKKYIHTSDTITEQGKLNTFLDNNLQATMHYFTDSVIFSMPLHIPNNAEVTIMGKFTYLGKKGDEFPNGEESFIAPLKKASQINITKNLSSTTTPVDSNTSLLKIFWIGLIAGIIAVFTPCVFPIIPVTVSFFLKRSKSKSEGIRNAVIYSLSIILIYTVPTFVLTKIFGDSVMYTIATSAISNLLFFAIFIIFAISFFGGFELNLPSSWANKADQRSGNGGLLGIFFMALTLVIVSFSCTGPFVGSLLAQVSSANNANAGTSAVIGILGLSSGLAIPFSLFAFFPSMLHALPKSGGWLNSVKVVFGFIELALAMKFLSMVDLIYGWHLLDREVFLAIWIVLSILTGIYLLGKLKFSHDSDLKFISIPRLFFSIIFLSFAMYLIPGMWGAPLKAMSGLLPPATTQDFNLNELQYKIDNIQAVNINGNSANAANVKATPPTLYTDKLHMPLGITAYFDLEEGMAAAKVLHKPVMLDFTGHSCANCRKMENEVWSDPSVLKSLKNDFVIISLYVDEPSTLPINQQYTTKDGKYIATLGAKNLDYEISKFGLNSQPLYMFLDDNSQPLSDIRYGYDANIQKFLDHLNMVKEKFKSEVN